MASEVAVHAGVNKVPERRVVVHDLDRASRSHDLFGTDDVGVVSYRLAPRSEARV